MGVIVLLWPAGREWVARNNQDEGRVDVGEESWIQERIWQIDVGLVSKGSWRMEGKEY